MAKAKKKQPAKRKPRQAKAPRVKLDDRGRPVLPEGWVYEGFDYRHKDGLLVKAQDLQSLVYDPAAYLARALIPPPGLTPTQRSQMRPKDGVA